MLQGTDGEVTVLNGSLAMIHHSINKLLLITYSESFECFK